MEAKNFETFEDLRKEAQGELIDERRTMAKERIKERLREIREAERVLGKMRRQFEALLERRTDDLEDISE